jgi:Tfp pilus assembly protein PilX
MDKLSQTLTFQQEGAALIVSLMLLVILTMLGISAMESTKLETKMATNVAEMNRALQMAEFGASRIHNELSKRVTDQLETNVSSTDLDGADEEGFLELKETSGETERIYKYKYDTVLGHFRGNPKGSTEPVYYYTTIEGVSGDEPDSPKVQLKVGWTYITVRPDNMMIE